jgi:hypothetical protein
VAEQNHGVEMEVLANGIHVVDVGSERNVCGRTPEAD